MTSRIGGIQVIRHVINLDQAYTEGTYQLQDTAITVSTYGDIPELMLHVQELADLMNEPLKDITVTPDEASLQQWEVMIRGPVSWSAAHLIRRDV